MKSIRMFTPDDMVTELVDHDYNVLPLLSRFSIPLGFGTRKVADVCMSAGIDVDVFLLIINFVISGRIDERRLERVSPDAIVDFLHRSHDYFMGYKFPHIRRNLLSALDEHQSDVNPAIIEFFDDYVRQVRIHFDYEETTVFPYVRALTEGRVSGYNIEEFRKHHDEVAEKLSDLKNVIMRYYNTSVPDNMYDVLVDLFNCEEDLESHNIIENKMLIPMVERMEHKPKAKGDRR
ncbi:MAG: hemerythrin domain-containing protein [Muribaculaceae bacterium]|nr:hemerythrin domain-containing protein [Muribaculaceae bacterium]